MRPDKPSRVTVHTSKANQTKVTLIYYHIGLLFKPLFLWVKLMYVYVALLFGFTSLFPSVETDNV